MKEIFKINMLPAEFGDCLWIEYGPASAPHRILVDGGLKGTYQDHLEKKIKGLGKEQRRFELLVVTHIDNDHIGGIIPLLKKRKETGISFEDIWFNGTRQLFSPPPPGNDGLFAAGVQQGETVSEILQGDTTLPWNKAFDGKSITVGNKSISLAGGMEVTLLSPGKKQISELKNQWAEVIQEREESMNQPVMGTAIGVSSHGRSNDIEQLLQKRFKEDKAVANGSSIAMLLFYQDKKVLLAGDAHPSVVAESLKRLGGTQPFNLDVCKLPHHGSKNNVSRQLLEAMHCDHFFISTNGSLFNHPDDESLARIVTAGNKQISFNYPRPDLKVWDTPELKEKFGHTMRFRAEHEEALSIDLL
ncbi:MAG: MBL fold metallo-hydrolase [Magnetococcales bacterium]|nr:MBL fold metallo-hydrolase [Magnetococcales bacterium]